MTAARGGAGNLSIVAAIWPVLSLRCFLHLEILKSRHGQLVVHYTSLDEAEKSQPSGGVSNSEAHRFVAVEVVLFVLVLLRKTSLVALFDDCMLPLLYFDFDSVHGSRLM